MSVRFETWEGEFSGRMTSIEGTTDYAATAWIIGLSRARVTQIMDLLYLASDIQEEILLAICAEKKELEVSERAMRQITCIPDWKYQRKQWQELSDSLIRRRCRSDMCKV